jgi:hypothetical protein
LNAVPKNTCDHEPTGALEADRRRRIDRALPPISLLTVVIHSGAMLQVDAEASLSDSTLIGRSGEEHHND